VTESGKSIPLDAEPVAHGNIRLVDNRAVVVGVGTLDLLDATDDGVRWVSHFVTCPDRDKWRRRNG
jgi:hypothetical protein